jgi:hypothetical protein
MKLHLEKTQYEKYSWNIGGDLKAIALLLGLQFGCTKLCCFLCEWDSSDRKSHISKNNGLSENRSFQGRKM